jgi:predicted RNase H-like HicB family nuclease/SAM-dependent methyltransferase
VITSLAGGRFSGRVRELADCTSTGDTPQDALAQLEVALEARLRSVASGGEHIEAPHLWDPAESEAFPVRLPRSDVAKLATLADAQSITVSELVRQSITRRIESADGPPNGLESSGPSPGRSPNRDLSAPDQHGRRPDGGEPHGLSARLADAIDRLIFPEAETSADHWQRVVMDRAIGEHLTALDPASHTAAEISGESHGNLPWRSYQSLMYPSFDLCAPLDPSFEFDVVICEQVLEHVDDPRAAAANLRDLCRPGGHVVVSTPFLIPVHELEQFGMRDYWRFTPRGLATLLEEAGLVVDAVDGWGNRWCVLGNLGHWARARRGLPLHNDPLTPVQVWAFARRP